MDLRRVLNPWRSVGQVIVLTWDRFWDDRCSMAASSLAYQTALALAPMLAIGLALLKASGQLNAGSELLSLAVQQIFPSTSEVRAEIVQRLSHFSDNIAAGALGSFGLVTAIGIGFLLFLNIESIWNHIWESHRERTYVERFLLFYAGITLLPFVAAISVLHTTALWGQHWLSRLLLSLVSTALVLTLANRMVPTLRVEWRAALIGGVSSAVLLELAKFGFGLYLSLATGKYHSIYGALGILPLFLLSIYLSWIILLWGVEVCHAVQRLPLLRQLRGVDRPADDFMTVNGPLAARLLCDVARNFKSGRKGMPVLELEQRHGLPESLVRRVFKRLAEHNLVAEVEDGYLLARSPEAIQLHEVLRIFQPSPHHYVQSKPDALDLVLAQIDVQMQQQTEPITFASLI